MGKNLKRIVYLIALLLVGLMFYFVEKNSNINNSDSSQAEFVATEKIKTLFIKAKARPNSVELWNELGREYLLKQNFEKAYQAFNESRQVDFSALFENYEIAGKNAIDKETRIERLKWLTGLAESRILAQGGAIDEESEKFLNLALALDPSHPKALWYGGLNAAQKGEYITAQYYWEKLQAQQPPGSLGQILDQRLESLKQVMATNLNLGNEASKQDADNEQWVLKLKINLLDELKQTATDQSRLYLSLRQKQQLPPLAAKQLLLSELSTVVTLSDNDSIPAMRAQQSANWNEPLHLDIIWSPTGKVGDNENIRFASIINRANLSGVNEFILDPKIAIK